MVPRREQGGGIDKIYEGEQEVKKNLQNIKSVLLYLYFRSFHKPIKSQIAYLNVRFQASVKKRVAILSCRGTAFPVLLKPFLISTNKQKTKQANKCTHKKTTKHKNENKLMGLGYIETEINLWSSDFFNKSSPLV